MAANEITEAVAPWIVGRMRNVTERHLGGFLILPAMALQGTTTVAKLPKRSARP